MDSNNSILDQDTSTDLGISSLNTNPCTTPHLKGSQVISLEKLCHVIYTITCNNTACQSAVELMSEVKHNGFGSILLAKCNKCSEEFIADGFKASELMHGLRYTEVIGDGDS